MARRTNSSALTKPPKKGADSDQGEALRLETRPSPVLPAVLAGSLSILVLALIGFAATVKVTQVVSVPGKLVTRRSTQDLTTPEPVSYTHLTLPTNREV